MSSPLVEVVITGNAESFVASLDSAAGAADDAVSRLDSASEGLSASLESSSGAASSLATDLTRVSGAAGDAAGSVSDAADDIKISLTDAFAPLPELDDALASLGVTFDSSAGMIDAGTATVIADIQDVITKNELLIDSIYDTGETTIKSSETSNGALQTISDMLSKLEGKFGIVGEAAGAMAAKIDESSEKADVGLNSVSGSADKSAAGMSLLGKASIAGFAVVSVAAVDLGMKYQELTTNVAAWGGISVAAATKITNSFLNTAGSTIYTASQIAKAYGSVVGQLTAVEGHALNSKEAMQVMSASMDLAEGSGTDLSTATSALSSIMQTYQLKTSGASKASDELFSTAKGAGVSLSQVSKSVTQVHTQLGALTPSLGDTGALLVDMVEHGMNGSRAMRVLGTSLNALLKPEENVQKSQANLKTTLDELPPSLQKLATEWTNNTITTAQASTAAQALGTQTAQLWSHFTAAQTSVGTSTLALKESGDSAMFVNGQFVGLGKAIGILHDQTKGMTESQQLSKLSEDGLASSAAKLLPIINAGSSAFDRASTEVNKAGAAHEAAAKQAATLQHELEQVKTTVEDLVTKFGVVLIPVLKQVIGVFNNATDFVMKHRIILYSLGVLIGGFLTATVLAFAINTLGTMTASIAKAGGSVLDLGGKILDTISPIEAQEVQAGLDAAALDGLAASADGAASAETALAGAAGDAAGAGGLADLTGGLGEAGVAAGGLAGTLGTIGLIALPLAGIAGIVALSFMHAHDQFDGAASSAEHMSTKSIPDLIAQNKALKDIQDKVTEAFKKASAAKNTFDENDPAADYTRTAKQGDDNPEAIGQAELLAKTNKGLSDALAENNKKMQEATSRAQTLATATGLNVPAVEALANVLKINLGQALSPKDFQKMINEVQKLGGSSAVLANQAKQYFTQAANAIQLLKDKAAINMPGVSAAVQSMLASTQPKLIDLVAQMNKSGDKSGASWVSAYLAHMPATLLASKNMHNAIMSPLLPLESELRKNGDKAAANLIAAFIGHQSQANIVANAMKNSLKNPLDGLAASLLPVGDKAGSAIVNSFLAHNSAAKSAALEVKGSISSSLTPLIGDLNSIGDSSGAAIIAGIQKHDADATNEANFFHDLIKHPLDGLKIQLGEAGDQAGVALVQNFENHKGSAITAANLTHDAITGKLNPLIKDLGTIADSSGQSLVTQFATHAASAGTAGNTIGSAMGNGIQHAIQQSSSAIDASLSTVIQNAMNAAKTAAGIASPSKRTATEIGLPLVQGIAQGILGGSGTVTAAMLSVTKMDKLASTALSSSAVVPNSSSSSGSASSGPITIALHIDGQQFAQAILNPLQSVALRNQKTGGQFSINMVA